MQGVGQGTGRGRVEVAEVGDLMGSGHEGHNQESRLWPQTT